MSVFGAGMFFVYVVFYFISISVSIAAVALTLLGYWKVFIKLGEPGWKGIIPYYNVYLLFQKLWNVKKFWTYIISMLCFIPPYIIGVLAMVFGTVFVAQGDDTMVPGIIVMIVGIVFFLIALSAVIFALVVEFKLYVRLAEAFGKSKAYAWGLLFLSPIFIMILGFDKSQYIPVDYSQRQY